MEVGDSNPTGDSAELSEGRRSCGLHFQDGSWVAVVSDTLLQGHRYPHQLRTLICIKSYVSANSSAWREVATDQSRPRTIAATRTSVVSRCAGGRTGATYSDGNDDAVDLPHCKTQNITDTGMRRELTQPNATGEESGFCEYRSTEESDHIAYSQLRKHHVDRLRIHSMNVMV